MSVNAKGRNIYTLQCENCYALETPEILTQMRSHFHLAGDDRRRLCEDCRRTVFADCECFRCKEERRRRMTTSKPCTKTQGCIKVEGHESKCTVLK